MPTDSGSVEVSIIASSGAAVHHFIDVEIFVYVNISVQPSFFGDGLADQLSTNRVPTAQAIVERT